MARVVDGAAKFAAQINREYDMAHKGQVGEPKGGSMGGKPTDMKTVKTVAGPYGKGK